MEATHLSKCQAIRSRKVEAQCLVIHYLAHRLFRKVEPRSGGMWSHPALHFIEVLFDVVCRDGLPVLETHSGAYLHLECTFVEPVCIGCQSIDHTPIFIHAD